MSLMARDRTQFMCRSAVRGDDLTRRPHCEGMATGVRKTQHAEPFAAGPGVQIMQTRVYANQRSGHAVLTASVAASSIKAATSAGFDASEA